MRGEEAVKEEIHQRLKGKVGFVTGGGSGIGKASALHFARHGAKVCILNLHMEPAKEVRGSLCC
jgi:NAD(P)-dependent dehydrogenase (short-subunit alcohol dehydrogenase family)